MTPEKLSDVFAFVEAREQRVLVVRVCQEEFEPIARRLDIFDRNQGPTGPVGWAWGAQVWINNGISRGTIHVTGGEFGEGHTDYLFELEPVVRVQSVQEYEPGPSPLVPQVEQVDPEQFKALADSFDQKLRDLRDHVAFDGHRDFTLVPGATTREGATASEVRFVQSWGVNCNVKECPRSWVFNEDEVAAAGRADLTDKFGWGAEIETAKLVPPRARPLVWSKVGRFLEDD